MFFVDNVMEKNYEAITFFSKYSYFKEAMRWQILLTSSKFQSHLSKKPCQQTFPVFQDAFSIKISLLLRRHQDVFTRRLYNVSFKTSSRRLANTACRRLEDVLKMSWKTKKCYVEDVLNTSSTRLDQDTFFFWAYIYT